MKKETINKLVKACEANYKKKVTVWGTTDSIFVECRGFKGPSEKVEKIIKDLGLTITEQRWSCGSDYTGYYYWVKE